MIKNVKGVLLDLNQDEKVVMARLLELAESSLDEFGRLPKGDGRYQSKDTSRRMAQAVIDGLWEGLGLAEVKRIQPAQTAEQVEAWRLRRAKSLDHHHTSKKAVRCAYDQCSAVLCAKPGDSKHVWQRALEKGWTPIDWKYHGKGGYDEATGYPSEDLICEAEHDRHGCAIYDGDKQNCLFWPNPDRD